MAPVWPMSPSGSIQPASTAPREAPTAAPKRRATSSKRAKFAREPSPRPPAMTISAPRKGRESTGKGSCPKTFMVPGPGIAHGQSIISPPAPFGPGAKAPRARVAIWGRWLGQAIVVSNRPPKVGSSARSSPSSSILRDVQSAIKPVPSRAATLGARDLPRRVPPKRRISGRRSSINRMRAWLCHSSV